MQAPRAVQHRLRLLHEVGRGGRMPAHDARDARITIAPGQLQHAAAAVQVAVVPPDIAHSPTIKAMHALQPATADSGAAKRLRGQTRMRDCINSY
jgi:hypothetical protein